MKTASPRSPARPSLNSVATLMRDHGDVEAMCSVFEAALTRMEQGKHVDIGMLAGTLLFFDQFVGESHQAKEEEALFPRLRALDERAAVLVEVLSAQHTDHRAMVRDLSAAAEQLASDPVGGQRPFILAARRYIASMRAHLQTENERLPEMCALALPPEQDDDLCRQFAEIERRSMGPTRREWYNQVIADYRDVVATWGTPFDCFPLRPSSDLLPR